MNSRIQFYAFLLLFLLNYCVYVYLNIQHKFSSLPSSYKRKQIQLFFFISIFYFVRVFLSSRIVVVMFSLYIFVLLLIREAIRNGFIYMLKIELMCCLLIHALYSFYALFVTYYIIPMRMNTKMDFFLSISFFSFSTNILFRNAKDRLCLKC